MKFSDISYVCNRCKSTAALEAQGVRCAACGTVSPRRHHSLDFMGPYEKIALLPASEMAAITETVRRVLDLPEAAFGALSDAVEASFERTGVAYVDAEIAALPSRFGLGPAIEDRAEARPAGEADFALAFIGHFSPPAAVGQATISRSIRIRAHVALPATGPGRVGFVYRWTSGDKSWRGRIRRYLRMRTSHITYVPIDVRAGREMTISIPMRTPRRYGEDVLEITPMIGRKAFPARSIRIPMTIVGEQGAAIDERQGFGDYGLDHQSAIDMLRAFLKSAGPQPGLFLEVASGVNPHLLALTDDGHRIVASDICSNQVQLGSIYAQYKFPDKTDSLMFASFDAFDPPFQPQQFDGVCIFAALHHFPDPVAFLKRLSGLVRPGGLIGIFCEPCDMSAIGEGYVRDLLAGINEQIFAVDEYRHMFVSAGLAEHAIRNDGGSLKAILSVA